MTIALYTLAAMVMLALFVHMSYVYVMGYKYARDNGGVPTPAKLFFFPTVAVMVPFYVLLNWTIGNILFLELDFHPQFTQRNDRHLAGPDGWRKRMAQFWCRNYLDPFDPAGVHCRHPKGGEESAS